MDKLNEDGSSEISCLKPISLVKPILMEISLSTASNEKFPQAIEGLKTYAIA